MEYRLDRESIKKHFRPNKNSTIGLNHNTSVRIKILPYSSKSKGRGFKSVLGEFSRLTSCRTLQEKLSVQSLIENVLAKVEFDLVDRTQLMSVIQKLFFNSNGEIEVFHPIVYNYIPIEQKEQKDIAVFLFDVLKAQNLRELIISNYDQTPNNILLKLIFESLPHQDKLKSDQRNRYHSTLPYVVEIFQQDFRYLLGDTKLYIEHYERLLKYYYYFYVSQLVIKFDQMFDADLTKPTPIYFTLDWEKNTSKSRTGYIQGWQLLHKRILKMFSHANCLEFLNHRHDQDQQTYNYVDLKKCIEQMSDEQRRSFRDDVTSLYKFYTSKIIDVNWEQFNVNQWEGVIQIIKDFFRAIDYQFNKSTRRKVYTEYSEAFIVFCRDNFLKRRGQLGYTLNITQEYILFLTRLCIRDAEKIRLKDLFYQFERRGLFLDRDSQQMVIKLFEKLNLLEKKSDSGDAQYVKAIL